MNDLSDLQEAYMMYHRNCGIKVGNYVKVMFTVPDYFGGWDGEWLDKKEEMVGEIYEVTDNDDDNDGFWLEDKNNCGYFPAFCLQKVENPNKEEEEMVDIDGKKFSVSTIKQALKDHCDF